VPQKTDYALLTRPALQYMQVNPARAGLRSHTERYEHFGDVECFVADLGRMRPATARTPRGAASQMARAESTLTSLASENAGA
jgi:hypothetical protein